MLQLRQMDDRVSVQRDWFKDYSFHLVERVNQVSKLVDICVQRGICSLDTETTGVDNRVYPDEYFEDGRETRHGIRTVDRIVGLCISFDGQNGYYLPLSHDPEDAGNLPWDPVWDEITRLVNNCRIIFHNMKFDAEFLYPVTGKENWGLDEFEDTMLLSKVISPLKSNPAGLKQRAKIDFGVDMVELDELFTAEKKDQLKREKVRYNFALLHPKEGKEYGASDGIFTYKEWFHHSPKLAEGDQRIYNLEKAFCNVIRKMERNRVHVDVDRVNQLAVECRSEMTKTGDIIREFIEKRTGQTGKWLTLNVGSPAQLSAALFTDPEGMKLKPTPEMVNEGDGGWGTNYDGGGGSDDDDDDDDPGKPKTYSLKDEVLKSLHRYYGKDLSVQRDGVVDKDGKPKRESIFELVLEYRHYDKMKGSYVEKLQKSHDKYGDVRPSFNQMGTDTARLSCKAGKIEEGYSGVNFQGIPRDSDDDKPELFKQVRTVIIPRPGWFLVKLDYSGEELRVVTNMSGDPIWTESFLHGDGDVHSITTRTLYGRQNITKGERNIGKRCNFAFIYGGGAGAISRNIGCTIEDGQRHMDNLRRDVPVLMGYVDHQKKFANKYKCIYTAFGRKMPIPTIDSPIRAIKKKAERCAINYTIQATSADVLKFAMCLIDKKIRELGWEDRVRYVLTVHDEIVFEIRPEYLMDVIPLLNEWMVLPWRLPKAHGRPWVVPLETEPGIDVHWRARFDFFQMTRGTRAKPEDIGPDGTYKGKLKDGQLFENGRIYQEIPDFLDTHVWRLPLDKNGEPIVEGGPTAPLPAPEPEPEPEPEVIVAKAEEPALSEGTKKVPEPVPEPVAKSEETNMDPGDIDIDIDIVGTEGFPDVQVDAGPVEESPPPKIMVKAKEARPVGPDEKVLRWVFKDVPSDQSMRKLLAVCILAEGQVPLRIVNKKDQVLIPEGEGVRVHPDRFQYLASLFGLG